MLKGIDVSSWQPSINWGAVAADHAFAIVKCTGGTTYQNPHYVNQINGARAAGMVVGHYHFAHEATLHQMPGGGPEAEAEFFLSQADIRPGELVALDIEDTAVSGDLSDWALRWLQRVEPVLGCKPLLYSFPNYIQTRGLGTVELAAYPLWYAYYPNQYDPARWPGVPGHWTSIAIWQWSGGTDVAGIPNDTDENVTRLTREELMALGKPAGTPPAGPTPPYARSIINERGEAVTEINWGGVADHVDGYIIQDAGIAVVNAAGETYDRSVTPAGFGEWRKRP